MAEYGLESHTLGKFCTAIYLLVNSIWLDMDWDVGLGKSTSINLRVDSVCLDIRVGKILHRY